MKMRVVIGVLLVLNAAVLAWQLDAFARWGWGPNVGREPERVQQQLRPEAIRFSVPAVAASEGASSAGAAPEASVPAVSDPAPQPGKDVVAAEEAAAASARAARKRARAAAAAAAAAAESQ